MRIGESSVKYGPEPEKKESAHGALQGSANPAWDKDAIAAMQSGDAEACGTALTTLSAAIFNEREAKAHAADAGALFAVVKGLENHLRDAVLQIKGIRCVRHLCFKNPLACASAPSLGVITGLVAAMNTHPTNMDLHHEAVWALSTLSLSYEKCLVAASREAYDILNTIITPNSGEDPKTIAMATFVLKKIAEWRCGGNR